MISALSSACGLIDPTQQMASIIVCAFALLLGLSQAYSPSLCTTTSGHSRRSSTSTMQATKKKWTKQRTLADASGEGVGSLGAAAVGLKGSIPVKFKQGETELTTMALVGQPLSDVATQAGQYIKYGCGKGECGTCEALCNGKWIRPCSTKVPALAAGETFTIVLKEGAAKRTSSGKFFSVRSFIAGARNNLLGMLGFVTRRRAAKENFQERLDLEGLVAQRTKEIKAARLAAEAAQKK